MQAAEPVILWRGGGGQRWTVAKVHNGGTVLTESMSLGVAKWQGEVREELMHLLAARIATKTLKSATIPGPKLLLLVDAYNYGDADDWEDVARLVSAGPFHTVARVYQEYACQVLTSMAGGWR
jgi:hypothetical protein